MVPRVRDELRSQSKCFAGQRTEGKQKKKEGHKVKGPPRLRNLAIRDKKAAVCNYFHLLQDIGNQFRPLTRMQVVRSFAHVQRINKIANEEIVHFACSK